MKKFSARLLPIVCCTSLFATAPSDEGQDAVLFNSSPLSVECQVLLEEIEQKNEEVAATAAKKISEYLQTDAELIAYLGAQELAEHTISRFPQENIIKLEDGSEWTVSETDTRYLRNWRSGHTVLLYPRPNDKDKPYMLENLSINRTINVNPFNGPMNKGPKTNWIVGLDPNLGHVFLMTGENNRSSWAIDKAYMPIFREWVVHHTIMIMNHHKSWAERFLPWLFPSYDYVLLNVNMVHNIPAKPL